MQLEDYRWFCSLSQHDPVYIDQDDILTLIEIDESVIDMRTRAIRVNFTMPIERGYFNIPEKAVYRIAMTWGVFRSPTDTDFTRVRGLVEPAMAWSLEYMALPDYLMISQDKLTQTNRPKTMLFIIGKSQPFGPLFPDPYFMEELEVAIIVMYVFSIFPYLGVPGFVTIAFFLTLYNFWSIIYGAI